VSSRPFSYLPKFAALFRGLDGVSTEQFRGFVSRNYVETRPATVRWLNIRVHVPYVKTWLYQDFGRNGFLVVSSMASLNFGCCGFFPVGISGLSLHRS
jgi:hypothetical protein